MCQVSVEELSLYQYTRQGTCKNVPVNVVCLCGYLSFLWQTQKFASCDIGGKVRQGDNVRTMCSLSVRNSGMGIIANDVVLQL